MELPAPFRSHGEHLAIDLPGARAVFTTRRGGVSGGAYASLNLGRWTDDEPGAVAENRRRVVAATEVPGARIAHARQVHGTGVVRVTAPPPRDAAPGEVADADGQATALPEVVPLVLVADCLPIALGAPGARAMLHGGWRGLADGIVSEGVAALAQVGGAGPGTAAIGPGARVCCYEAGEEVHEAFAHLGPGLRRGRHLDLAEAARRLLRDAGVREVHDCGLCTMCEPDLFFSHRRDAGVTGRQAGVVHARP